MAARNTVSQLKIVIPRGRSAAEQRLAAIAALHQPMHDKYGITATRCHRTTTRIVAGATRWRRRMTRRFGHTQASGCETGATGDVLPPDHHVRNARGQIGEGPSALPAVLSADPRNSRARAARLARGAASLALAMVRLAGVPILAAAALHSYLDALWAHGLADVYPPEVQIADCLSRFDALLSTIVYSGVAPGAVLDDVDVAAGVCR